MNRPLLMTAAAAALVAPTLAIATTATLTASKDNTLIQDAAGSVSNGQGTLFVGNTGAFSGVNAHRTVLSFDVASSLPAGATITSVTLSLHVNKTVAGTPEIAEIHRLLANWGEGTSNTTTGAGAPATPGDATWLHTFYPGSLWSAPGGDFSSATSSTTSLAGVGTYTFPSTPQLVADVQGWLNSPSTNFGWVILGDEANIQTVRAIDSRESLTAAFRPALTLTFSAPLAGDANQNGTIDRDDFTLIDRGFAKHLTGFVNGDFNGDGTIDQNDYAIIDNAFYAQGGHAPDFLDAHLTLFGPSYANLLTFPVPEPTALFAACGLALPLLRRRR